MKIHITQCPGTICFNNSFSISSSSSSHTYTYIWMFTKFFNCYKNLGKSQPSKSKTNQKTIQPLPKNNQSQVNHTNTPIDLNYYSALHFSKSSVLQENTSFGYHLKPKRQRQREKLTWPENHRGQHQWISLLEEWENERECSRKQQVTVCWKS